ncbi:MAG: hypothetical protein OZSIB_2110 [Candidatus Ozemobacter sibiricus]|jgi:hypothetical protein|uniref:Uncharacterized protein n=1 Tax=Candidatus Ozemobacter sibiricus TaxID=2268124 RepID=A0A367ZV84_9BACT|nr:MAG: hypothetical protein OZSIB_2110 [Candidatus Ozemobacter sibiricus]
MKEQGRTTFEWLLYIGILTFFLWPFVQLWSIQAIPAWDSDEHQRAAVALGNLMAEALARPVTGALPNQPFTPIPGGESMSLEGSVEYQPHLESAGMTLVRAQVRWGLPIFRKYLTLETLVGRSRP